VHLNKDADKTLSHSPLENDTLKLIE